MADTAMADTVEALRRRSNASCSGNGGLSSHAGSFVEAFGSSDAQVREVCQSYVDPAFSRPIRLSAHDAGGIDEECGDGGSGAQRELPMTLMAAIIVVALYFDNTVAIWNQVYKVAQDFDDGPACGALWHRVTDGLDYEARATCDLKDDIIIDASLALEELKTCLRAPQTCSNIRSSVLAKVTGNELLGNFQPSICESAELAEVSCDAEVGGIETAQISLVGLFEGRSIHESRWGDLCPKKCGRCSLSTSPDAASAGSSSPQGAKDDQAGSWLRFFKTRRLTGAPASAAFSVDRSIVATTKWPSGDWTAGLGGFLGASLSKESPADVGPGEVYFDRGLQHPHCSWYLVQVSRAPRGDFLWMETEREICGKASTSLQECKLKRGCAYFDALSAPHFEEGAGCYFKDCSQEEGGTCYRRAVHSYVPGGALFIQAVLATLIFWSISFLFGGKQRLMMCFDRSRLMQFSLVGFFFGLASCFAFLAQSCVTPGSYMLYTATAIIVVPVMWRFTFRTPIPALTWLHIAMTGFGILMYCMAEQDDDGGSLGNRETLGIFYILMKVLMAGTASVFAELSMKSGDAVPFSVQVSYILPWKALACLVSVLLVAPHRLPPTDVRPGGLFHDYRPIVFVVIFHTVGDTIMAGLVARFFDSVVRALCAVLGIIMPTWIVSYFLGWDKIDFATVEGKFKACGGIVVIAASFAYVLGRMQASELDGKILEVAELKQREVFPCGGARGGGGGGGGLAEGASGPRLSQHGAAIADNVELQPSVRSGSVAAA